MKKLLTTAIITATLFGLVAQAGAQIQVLSDGSDGPAIYDVNTVVDLSQAASHCDCDGDGIANETCRWDCPSPDPGKGVYDPDKWAVVFKFTSINVASGATVTFSNHPSGAPVVWLVQGDVQIEGAVSLDGQDGTSGIAATSVPGPGGFRGGQGCSGSNLDSAGFGPGGGTGQNFQGHGIGGSYATLAFRAVVGFEYGNERIIPLIGGSGGSAEATCGTPTGGGAGGGAILIAARGFVEINGSLSCTGGDKGSFSAGGTGSGGAIRIIADNVRGSGRLDALSGAGLFAGGFGRIRIEANINSLPDNGRPSFTEGLPGDPPMIWPPDTAPKLTPVALDGITIPLDPRSMLDFPLADVAIANGGIVQLEIQADNVPLSSTMNVRIVPKSGDALEFPATPVAGGNDIASTWVADIDMLPNGISAIQVRAELP